MARFRRWDLAAAAIVTLAAVSSCAGGGHRTTAREVCATVSSARLSELLGRSVSPDLVPMPSDYRHSEDGPIGCGWGVGDGVQGFSIEGSSTDTESEDRLDKVLSAQPGATPVTGLRHASAVVHCADIVCQAVLRVDGGLFLLVAHGSRIPEATRRASVVAVTQDIAAALP